MNRAEAYVVPTAYPPHRFPSPSQTLNIPTKYNAALASQFPFRPRAHDLIHESILLCCRCLSIRQATASQLELFVV